MLPIHSIALPGPLDLNKATTIALALFVGTVVFGFGKLAEIRWRGGDVLMLGAISAGALSSLHAGLGAYDAFTQFVRSAVTLGVPYVVGAAYFGDRASLNRLLIALFVSGLVYAPLCLYEVRMSPQLHAQVYGAAQHSFLQTVRGGGWRPMVFMHHGLELSLWLGAATVAGMGLLRSGLRTMFGIPMPMLVFGLFATTILCKSTGAILLTSLALFLQMFGLRRGALLAILLAIPAYLAARILGGGRLEAMLVEAAHLISDERAQSLQFRFSNEVLLLSNLDQSLLFGGGLWNFGVYLDHETGNYEVLVPDSLWIIEVSTKGLFGMVCVIGMLWVPATRTVLQPRRLQNPVLFTGGLILATLILDTMSNAFVPQLYLALAGGLMRYHGTAAAGEMSRAATVPSSFEPLRPRTS